MAQGSKTPTRASPKDPGRKPEASAVSPEEVRVGPVFTCDDDAPLMRVRGFQMKVDPGEAREILNNAITGGLLDSCGERSASPQYVRRKKSTMRSQALTIYGERKAEMIRAAGCGARSLVQPTSIFRP
jgi:hypothetical protein